MDGQLATDTGPVTAQLTLNDLLPCGTSIKLLRFLRMLAENKDKITKKVKDYACIGYKVIAEFMGCTERHAYRLVNQLVDAGFVEKEIRPGHEPILWVLVTKWQIPGLEAFAPRPSRPRQSPMRTDVPKTRKPLIPDNEPAQATEHNEASQQRASNSPESSKSSPAMSGVMSGPESSPSFINIGKWEKQYTQAGEKRQIQEPETVLPSIAGPIVAVMKKYKVWKQRIVPLVESLGVEFLEIGFGVTLWRIEKGTVKLLETDIAAYALEHARRYKTGEWTIPGWWHEMQGEKDRKAEIERARANKVVTAPRETSPRGDGAPPKAMSRALNASLTPPAVPAATFDPMQIPESERESILRESQDRLFERGEAYKGMFGERAKEKVRKAGWKYVGVLKEAERVWGSRNQTADAGKQIEEAS